MARQIWGLVWKLANPVIQLLEYLSDGYGVLYSDHDNDLTCPPQKVVQVLS
jgi:hypothetical protein